MYMYILLCWLIGSEPKIILRYDFSSSFIPGDRPALLKDCNKLVNMETTREDIMAETECEVDSTTEESPLKKKPKIEKSKKAQKTAKIDAAKKRA